MEGRRPALAAALSLALAALALTTCGGGEASAPESKGPLPYEKLSTYGFFTGPLVDQAPAAGVVPYDVSAPLWSDGAAKGRFFVLPPGGQIEWTEADDWG